MRGRPHRLNYLCTTCFEFIANTLLVNSVRGEALSSRCRRSLLNLFSFTEHPVYTQTLFSLIIEQVGVWRDTWAFQLLFICWKARCLFFFALPMFCVLHVWRAFCSGKFWGGSQNGKFTTTVLALARLASATVSDSSCAWQHNLQGLSVYFVQKLVSQVAGHCESRSAQFVVQVYTFKLGGLCVKLATQALRLMRIHVYVFWCGNNCSICIVCRRYFPYLLQLVYIGLVNSKFKHSYHSANETARRWEILSQLFPAFSREWWVRVHCKQMCERAILYRIYFQADENAIKLSYQL